MQTPLELYESVLRQVCEEECVDAWFGEQLAKCRAGDSLARQRICGSCLFLALRLTKERLEPTCPIPEIELVQDANGALVDALDKFVGSTAQEFVRHATAEIEHRLTLRLQHPE